MKRKVCSFLAFVLLFSIISSVSFAADPIDEIAGIWYQKNPDAVYGLDKYTGFYMLVVDAKNGIAEYILYNMKTGEKMVQDEYRIHSDPDDSTHFILVSTLGNGGNNALFFMNLVEGKLVFKRYTNSDVTLAKLEVD